MGDDLILPPGKVLAPQSAESPGAPQLDANYPATVLTASGGRKNSSHVQATTAAPDQRVRYDNGAGRSERFGVLNDFVDTAMREASPGAVAAWLVLWRDTKPNGLATTGLTDIARRMGVSMSTVKRALRELKELGLVSVKRRGTKDARPNTYRVHGTNKAHRKVLDKGHR